MNNINQPNPTQSAPVTARAAFIRYRDKVNGNSYYVGIAVTSDGRVISIPYAYGYGEQPRADIIAHLDSLGILTGLCIDLGYSTRRAVKHLGAGLTPDGNELSGAGGVRAFIADKSQAKFPHLLTRVLRAV